MPAGGDGDMLKLRKRFGDTERLRERDEGREKLRDGCRCSKVIERLLAERAASLP